MTRKTLLTLFVASFCLGAIAQKKQSSPTFAITGLDKGSHKWTEVRMLDVQTGEEIKPVYQSSQEVSMLNARTKKPVEKKDHAVVNERMVNANKALSEALRADVEYRISGQGKDQVIIVRNAKIAKEDGKENVVKKRVIIMQNAPLLDKPFSTNSAACAYDQKHNRLYYTPMGINELRYIDLKSNEPRIYSFENEAFGALAHRHDVPNQITRMAIASDGNGYALTNNAGHLIRFTTNKRAQITNLGALKDDAANGENSISHRTNYGGDMVADDDKNLYLVTANRNVYKISIENMVAKWLGKIEGLPRGYTTNGAAVEDETTVIVSSSNSNLGLYKFNIKTLQAEKMSASENMYRISDLANANLLSDKKKKDETEEVAARNGLPALEERGELNVKYKLGAYPNPVLKGGVLNLTFNEFPHGRYQVQLMDLNGKLLRAENLNVGQRMQIHLLQLPKSLAQGTYLVKIVGDANKDKVLVTEQVVVQ